MIDGRMFWVRCCCDSVGDVLDLRAVRVERARAAVEDARRPRDDLAVERLCSDCFSAANFEMFTEEIDQSTMKSARSSVIMSA